jgi:hypothetical protein
VDLDRERLVNSEQGRRIWLREGRRQLDELRRRRARPIARSRTERLRESKRGLEEVRPPPLPPRPDTIELRALMGRYGAGANTGRLATTHAFTGDARTQASTLSPVVPVGRFATQVIVLCGGVRPPASSVNHDGA